eukprot:Gb_22687 [translate_table: standard]
MSWAAQKAGFDVHCGAKGVEMAIQWDQLGEIASLAQLMYYNKSKWVMLAIFISLLVCTHDAQVI